MYFYLLFFFKWFFQKNKGFLNVFEIMIMNFKIKNYVCKVEKIYLDFYVKYFGFIYLNFCVIEESIFKVS